MIKEKALRPPKSSYETHSGLMRAIEEAGMLRPWSREALCVSRLTWMRQPGEGVWFFHSSEEDGSGRPESCGVWTQGDRYVFY